MCGWNDTTGKCRKKSVRKSPNPKLKTKPNPNPKPKEIKCPDFTIEKDCIESESCSWNDITNKCRKKSIKKMKEPKTNKPKEPIVVQKPKPKLGIHIGETTINRLSGPVSLYYLKPPAQVPSPLFPSIMLFGDYHFEKTHTCFKCNCYKDIKDIYQQTEILQEISRGWKTRSFHTKISSSTYR